MKSDNPMLDRIVNRGQQADGIGDAQPPSHDGCSNRPLDDILPPAAEEMIGDLGEESDDVSEMQRPNPTCIPMTKTGFQKFE